MLRSFFILTAVGLVGAPISPAQVKQLGPIEITVDPTKTAVRVSGSTPEVDALARQAFKAHGRYTLMQTQTGGSFELRFSALGGNQAQVEISKAGSVVASQAFTGNNLRNAVLRAADFAVEKTSGLKGFFASQLTFIVESGSAMEVYTADLFMGNARQLTNDRAKAVKPRWSPDGSKILYTSTYKSNYADIFLIDLRSLQRTPFVQLQGTNIGGPFSPNGQQVAMVLTGEGNPEIYVSNAQGKQISRRTRTAAIESSPCFSPDGSQIVYASDAPGGNQLFVMSASGGSPRRLATQISGYCAEPNWSRGNPNLIAFTIRIGRGFQIAVFDMSKREAARVVSKSPADATDPVWMADGRHLIYTEKAPNARRLILVDTASTKPSVGVALSSTGMRVSEASVWGP